MIPKSCWTTWICFVVARRMELWREKWDRKGQGWSTYLPQAVIIWRVPSSTVMHILTQLPRPRGRHLNWLVDQVDIELLPSSSSSSSFWGGAPDSAGFAFKPSIALNFFLSWTSMHVARQSVLPCLSRPADRSRSFHHQPSTYMHSHNQHRPFFPHVHVTRK